MDDRFSGRRLFKVKRVARRCRKGNGTMEETRMVEVTGKFDAGRFYRTLALILSRREHVQITAVVTEKADGQQDGADISREDGKRIA